LSDEIEPRKDGVTYLAVFLGTSAFTADGWEGMFYPAGMRSGRKEIVKRGPEYFYCEKGLASEYQAKKILLVIVVLITLPAFLLPGW